MSLSRRAAVAPTNKQTPEHGSVDGWRRQALLRRRESVLTQDGARCPLSFEPVAALPRKDLYLATDGHLYAGSAFVSYVVHALDEKPGKHAPLRSPLTRAPLQRDLDRLFACELRPAFQARLTLRGPERMLLIGLHDTAQKARALMAALMVRQLGSPPSARQEINLRGWLIASACCVAAILFSAQEPRVGQPAGRRAFGLARDACALGLSLTALSWSCAFQLRQTDASPPGMLQACGVLGAGSFALIALTERLLEVAQQRQRTSRDLGASSRFFSAHEDIFDDPELPQDLVGLFDKP